MFSHPNMLHESFHLWPISACSCSFMGGSSFLLNSRSSWYVSNISYDGSMWRTVYLPTWIPLIFMVNDVGKYTSPMDGMGKHATMFAEFLHPRIARCSAQDQYHPLPKKKPSERPPALRSCQIYGWPNRGWFEKLSGWSGMVGLTENLVGWLKLLCFIRQVEKSV